MVDIYGVIMCFPKCLTILQPSSHHIDSADNLDQFIVDLQTFECSECLECLFRIRGLRSKFTSVDPRSTVELASQSYRYFFMWILIYVRFILCRSYLSDLLQLFSPVGASAQIGLGQVICKLHRALLVNSNFGCFATIFD